MAEDGIHRPQPPSGFAWARWRTSWRRVPPGDKRPSAYFLASTAPFTSSALSSTSS